MACRSPCGYDPLPAPTDQARSPLQHLHPEAPATEACPGMAPLVWGVCGLGLGACRSTLLFCLQVAARESTLTLALCCFLLGPTGVLTQRACIIPFPHFRLRPPPSPACRAAWCCPTAGGDPLAETELRAAASPSPPAGAECSSVGDQSRALRVRGPSYPCETSGLNDHASCMIRHIHVRHRASTIMRHA